MLYEEPTFGLTVTLTVAALGTRIKTNWTVFWPHHVILKCNGVGRVGIL